MLKSTCLYMLHKYSIRPVCSHPHAHACTALINMSCQLRSKQTSLLVLAFCLWTTEPACAAVLAGTLVPEICKEGIPAALDTRGTFVMQCILDTALRHDEVLEIAKALLPVGSSGGIPSLFYHTNGLIVMARLVEHLVSAIIPAATMTLYHCCYHNSIATACPSCKHLLPIPHH